MAGQDVGWPLPSLDLEKALSTQHYSTNRDAILRSTALFSAHSPTTTPAAANRPGRASSLGARSYACSYASVDSALATEGTGSCCSTAPSTLTSWDENDEVDFLELSDEPPSAERLEVAGEVPVYDGEGNSRPFHTLFRGAEHQGQRQLIIFVRHLNCGACQAYLRRLTETITPDVYFSIPTPTTITVISCGAPAKLNAYAEVTGCPFRLYTDPTSRLYRLFGMPRSMNFGRKPEYVERCVGKMVLEVAGKIVVEGARSGYRGATAAGPLWQIGGEFLFEEERPVWCHRMRNIRGHAEMDVLLKVLGLDEASAARSGSLSSASSRSSARHVAHAVTARSATGTRSTTTPSPPSPTTPTTPTTPTSPTRARRSVSEKSAFGPDSPGNRLRIHIDNSGDVPRATLRRDPLYA